MKSIFCCYSLINDYQVQYKRETRARGAGFLPYQMLLDRPQIKIMVDKNISFYLLFRFISFIISISPSIADFFAVSNSIRPSSNKNCCWKKKCPSRLYFYFPTYLYQPFFPCKGLSILICIMYNVIYVFFTLRIAVNMYR